MSLITTSFSIRLICMLTLGTTPVSTLWEKMSKDPTPNGVFIASPFSSSKSLPKNNLTMFIADHKVPFEVNIRYKRKVNSAMTELQYAFDLQQRFDEVQMNNIAMSGLINFFLDSSPGKNVYIFYDQHLFPDMSDVVSSYHKVLVETTFLECEKAIADIEQIVKSLEVLDNLRKILLLCSPGQTKQVFQKVNENYLESESMHWFVVLRDERTTKGILSFLREGTQVSFAIKEFDYIYQLYNSYITINNEVSLRSIGWWSWEAETGSFSSLKSPLVKPLDEVYSDFGGRQLTVAVIENWPYWHIEYHEDESAHPVSGLDYHVLTDISQKLNFTFVLKLLPRSFGWGKVKSDGSVSGMVGEVHYHSVHLAINEVTLTENRERAVDFTYPYFLESKILISPAPKEKLKTYAVFTSFTYEVWILLVIVTVLIGPIVKAIAWMRQSYSDENIGIWNSLSDISFTMFKSIMLQAAPYPPKGLVYTMVFISWYIFCLLVTSLYSDVMISTLVVPSYEKPIDSLWDLLDAIEHRDYMVILNCGSNNEFIFTSTNQKIYKDIGNTFDYSLECIKSKDLSMDKVLTGKYVVVNNRMSTEVRANLRGRERYHIARNEFYAHGYGIACPNGSPYRDSFQKVVLPLMWSGLVQKYTNDELRKALNPVIEEDEGLSAISLSHLQAAFFMFVFGNLAATAALLTEKVAYRYCRQ